MSSVVELASSITEPVDLATAKQFLRLPAAPGPDDGLITDVIIPGARRQLETALGLVLANRKFVQYEDGFPFFPYFQSPYAPLFGAAFPFYFGYGPVASYPYPAIGGLQNQLVSPFVRRLLRSPVTSVQKITYIDNDQSTKTLTPGTDFIVDYSSLPGRISPKPGTRWPVGISGNASVAIYYSAGYLPKDSAEEDVPVNEGPLIEYEADLSIPANLYLATLQLIVHYYQQRSPLVTTAGAGGTHVPLPLHVQEIIGSERIWDFER